MQFIPQFAAPVANRKVALNRDGNVDHLKRSRIKSTNPLTRLLYSPSHGSHMDMYGAGV